MNFSNIKVYIAAPFFTEQQLIFVKEIENTLDKYGVKYFSPRLHGVIQDMPVDTSREQKMKAIFDMNIENIDLCNLMVAVIDDRDVGTMFEMGYVYGTSMGDINIVSITGNNHGINVMLRYAVSAHLFGVADLDSMLQLASYNGVLDDRQYSFFQNFPAKVQ